MSRAPEPRPGLGWARNLWILPALLFGFFTWVSFLYAGTRARRRDWLLAAGGYALVTAFIFTAFGRVGDGDPNGLLTATLAFTWWGGFIHVLWVNALWRRQQEGAASPLGAGRRRRRAAPEPVVPAGDGNFGLGDPAGEFLADRPAPEPAVDPVDVNTASARAIGRLPGLDASLARRIVTERERLGGGFDDLDHLARVVNLQPHVMVGLEGRVAFSKTAGKPTEKKPPGRVLDV